MIPKNKEDIINQYKTITNIIQSDEVKGRAKKLRYKVMEHKTEGTCSICKRTNILIFNEKFNLCLRCDKWCRKYLTRKFGHVSVASFIEAISYFTEPVRCQFYEFCGNTTSRLKENGEFRSDNKRWVCDKCYPMWEAGFRSGKRHITDTVKKGRVINEQFNR